MCYSYNRDSWRDTRKDAAKDSEDRPETRAEAPEFRFWAFPRRSKEFTVEEPEKVRDRAREKVLLIDLHEAAAEPHSSL